MDLPIFFPSVVDAGDAARNDLVAIGDNPAWVLLRYVSNANMDPVVKRDWFDRAGVQTICPSPRPTGMECDEYPYYSSDFAGAWDEFIGQTSPVSTHLKLVPREENNAEGNKLRTFYSRCAQTGTYDASTKQPTRFGSHYLTIPLVVSTDAPTFYAC
jgi:hypothetical protein